jgi:hypothetical protein
MLPAALAPTDALTVALPNGAVALALCRARFAAAGRVPGAHDFGGKELLLVDGRPQFAEVAILRLFEEAGWEGRWVETYPYRKNPRFWREWNPQGPQAQVHVPIAEPWVRERLQAIAAANGGYFSGCWDVVAWKDGRLVFAESKRAKRDRMRNTQWRWLEAAMNCGCTVEDFLIVEWALA